MTPTSLKTFSLASSVFSCLKTKERLITSSLRKQCFLEQSNMVRAINFRLLIPIVLCYFIVMFACCCYGDNFHSNRPEVKAGWNIKEVSYDKASNGEESLEEDRWIPPMTNNAKKAGGNDTKKKYDLILETSRKSKIRKRENLHALQVRNLNSSGSRNEMKSPRSSSNLISTTHEIPLTLLSPILSKVKVNSKKATTNSVISHSSKSKRRDNESENTAFSSLINELYRLDETGDRDNFGLIPTQHVRKRRERDVTSGRVARSNVCGNYITNINYNDEYKLWKNFSIKYQDRIYQHDEYQVTHDGLQLCNSSDLLIRRRWRNLTAMEKRMRVFEHCNVSVDIFPQNEYILYKDFTVLLIPAAQNFTWQMYGVFYGAFLICSAKLSLSCDDFLVTVKYEEQYNVLQNFLLLYNEKTYNYDEYRVANDGLEMCASNDARIQAVWKARLFLKKEQAIQKCNGSLKFINYYAVNKRLTVYWAASGQYFTRHDYAVWNNTLIICDQKLEPLSVEYSVKDMSMCNDSIITIKYDDEYSVWSNFSLVFQNEIYDYTEYRILTDRLTICNSTENFVQNAWKLRNNWIKGQFVSKEHAIRKCNGSIMFLNYYVVDKRFTVYWAASGQFFTRFDYAVVDRTPQICDEKLKPQSADYTEEDMSMCNDSIITMKYDDEYKVLNNFSLVFKNEIYDYTEYRIFTDRLTVCNSADNFVQNAWRLRNNWIKVKFVSKGQAMQKCSGSLMFLNYYVVNKRFTLYWAASGQYFKRYDYAVWDNTVFICDKKLRRESTTYTKEDLSMCNDSVISINYDDKFRVWNNFSMLYNKNMYDYTDYRILTGVITVCNSTDSFVQNAWRLRNSWIKSQNAFKTCVKDDGPKNCHSNSIDGYLQNIWTPHNKWINECDTSLVYQVNSERYIVLKDFNVRITKTGQILDKNEYGIIDGELYVCHDIVWSYLNLKYYIAVLFILSLSAVCLILLLTVYCSLPELRTLPGMNIMSLSIAFMLWDINAIGYLSLRFTNVHLRVNSLCLVEDLTFVFVEFSILTNAAVNVYHLKKTFCRNILLKCNKNGLKSFLKYALFSWGAPVILGTAEVVFLKADFVRLTYDPITLSCKPIRISLALLVIPYTLDGCLMLYIIVTFILAAYRIREKLKASSNIAQKSHTVKKRNSFVLLLKLSTTTGLTWFPGKLLVHANISPLLVMVILIIVLLSGVYVAIAFVFTRKNYRLLKKKYFSKKDVQVNG